MRRRYRPGAVLGQSRWYFPAVLFPSSVDRAHTRTWTGRAVLPGIKAGLSAVTIWLTADELIVEGRFFGAHHLRIRLADVTDVAAIDGKRGAVSVTFTSAQRSRWVRVITSGQPGAAPDRVVLSVEDQAAWVEEIARRIPGSAEPSR